MVTKHTSAPGADGKRACVEREMPTYPFCPPIVCKDCGYPATEQPAVFVGGLKEGTPTYAAWKLAGQQGRHSDQLALEASAQPGDLVTEAPK